MRILLFLLLGVLPAAAQDNPPMLAVRLSGPVQIDGRVEEAAWLAIESLPLVQFGPTFGAPMTLPAQIRIGYDDDYLYVSSVNPDVREPHMTTYRRDAWDGDNDQVAVSIDSYNDFENSLVFALYPTGARIDASFSNDARQIFDANVDWNTFWDAETTVSDSGWVGEMRIPWSSLRFEPDEDGRTTMGIVAYRFTTRNQELQIFPEIAPDWGFWSFVKPSKGRRFQFEGLKAKRPLYVTPYVTAGLGQDFELNDAETAYLRDDNPTYDAGLDLKYGLTSNMTLDLTLNTDFAQVEADDQQVNLTRFSLFFPEKRQFFLERTSNFDFSFGGFDRVFYSRRIGLHEGQDIRLLGGARVVGRSGRWDVGLLSLQAARDKDILSENFTVLRLKRNVINPNSYIGQIATTRINEDGTYNAVYGLDGVFNVHGDEYIRLAWAQSFETDGVNELTTAENSRFRAVWQRARQTGLGYEVGLSRAGSAYDPAMGFQLRENFTEVIANGGYGWRPEAPSPVNSHGIAAKNEIIFRNTDGALETFRLSPGYQVNLRSGWNFLGGITLAHEDLLEGFELSDEAEIPAGDYRYASASAGFGTPTGRPLRFSASVEAGSYYDGRQAAVFIQPSWSPSPRFNLTGTYRYDHIRFPERDGAFDAHIVRLRGDLTLNTKLNISSFLQLNSSVDAALANIRLRFNPRDGNDFYLVYNEGINTDRYASEPGLPFTDTRTIIAKYTYTFLR